jgi:integrase
MAEKLTALFVDSVEAPQSGQVDYWDAQVRGFGLRVSFGGKKSWTVMYRHNGRLRRMTIGTYPTLGLADARTEAARKLRAAAVGEDPAREKQDARRADTFADLAKIYIEKHAKPMKRTWKEDQRKIDRNLLPRWKNLKPIEIRRRDVITLIEAIVGRGSPVEANRVRALISKIFNFAIRRGLLETNPAYLVENPGVETSRDRVLSEQEIKKLWKAAAHEKAPVFDVFRIAFLTAQRRGEVLGMEWDEVDLKNAWWTIPASRSKNRLAHRVPLCEDALVILRDRKKLDTSAPRPRDPSAFVFRCRYGVDGDAPMSEIQKAVFRLRKSTGIDFVFHDLRRTAASSMTAIGISRLVVSKILNHVERGITAVYDRHSYDAEKREAVTRWSQRLGEIIAAEEGEAEELETSEIREAVGA